MKFNSSVEKLNQATTDLCIFIQNNALNQAQLFFECLRKGPISSSMTNDNIKVINLSEQAKNHKSFVLDQLYYCNKLKEMLTKGLENSKLITMYLNEFNYGYVEIILGAWYGNFLEFSNLRFTKSWHLAIILEYFFHPETMHLLWQREVTKILKNMENDQETIESFIQKSLLLIEELKNLNSNLELLKKKRLFEL